MSDLRNLVKSNLAPEAAKKVDDVFAKSEVDKEGRIPTTVYLGKEVKKAIKNYAIDHEITMSEAVNKILQEYLNT